MRVREFISVSVYNGFEVRFLQNRSVQLLSNIPEVILVATAPKTLSCSVLQAFPQGQLWLIELYCQVKPGETQEILTLKYPSLALQLCVPRLSARVLPYYPVSCMVAASSCSWCPPLPSVKV